jgi:cytochrome b561
MTLVVSRRPEPAAVPVHAPRFDGLTVAIHWASLALVLALFGTAWSIDAAPPELARPLLTAHRSLGLIVWLLTLLRLVWRGTGIRRPQHPAAMPAWQVFAARANHAALYALLLVQPLTGLGQTLLLGRAFQLLLWRVPPLVPRDRALAQLTHDLHEGGGYLLAAAVGLHALAALAHHFVVKDQVLAGMLRGRPRSPR